MLTWSSSTLVCCFCDSSSCSFMCSISRRFFSASARTAASTLLMAPSMSSSDAFRKEVHSAILSGSAATAAAPPSSSNFALSCSPCWKSSTMTDWALMDAAAAMTDTCLWRLLEISLNLAVSLPLMMSCVMKYCILSRWQNASPSSICVWGRRRGSRQSDRARVWVTEKI